MHRLVGVTAHAVDARFRIDQTAEFFEVGGATSPMTLPTGNVPMLEFELEPSVRTMVEHGGNKLGPSRGMTCSTTRRIAKRFKPASVAGVFRVADLARSGGFAFAFRLGVAAVALELAMRRPQIELGLLRVVKVLLAQLFECWRVALLALVAVKQVPFVRADVTTGVAAPIGLCRRQIKYALWMAFRAGYVAVRSEQWHPCVPAIIVVEFLLV